MSHLGDENSKSRSGIFTLRSLEISYDKFKIQMRNEINQISVYLKSFQNLLSIGPVPDSVSSVKPEAIPRTWCISCISIIFLYESSRGSSCYSISPDLRSILYQVATCSILLLILDALELIIMALVQDQLSLRPASLMVLASHWSFPKSRERSGD